MRRASIQGLDGMSLSELARDVGLSKAGVIGPFGSKQALQLAALARGAEVFREAVWLPAAELPAGRPRLNGIGGAWFDYLERCPLPGGCFVTTASVEWDARGGPVRDAVAELQGRWMRTLAADAETAIRAGALSADAEPAGVAFELNAIALGLNLSVQLLDDAEARRHADRALERLLRPQAAALA